MNLFDVLVFKRKFFFSTPLFLNSAILHTKEALRYFPSQYMNVFFLFFSAFCTIGYFYRLLIEMCRSASVAIYSVKSLTTHIYFFYFVARSKNVQFFASNDPFLDFFFFLVSFTVIF